AIAAAEFLQTNFPDRTGFSPRNVRQMRDFYRTYENRLDIECGHCGGSAGKR
ncbi:DUF1016 family protein, partial [Oscillibacter sp. MCC667]|nr:DUF1016 family protein [Oscillibacter sp. MCC667]